MAQKLFMGELLKRLRKRSGLTSKEVAKELKISQSTYLNYESDLREPPFRVIIGLCKLYKLYLDEVVAYLVEGTPIEIEHDLLLAPYNYNDEYEYLKRELLLEFEKLNKEGKEIAINLIWSLGKFKFLQKYNDKEKEK